jgi:hypothetical protein
MPHLCTATAIGKMDWGTGGWAVEIDPAGYPIVSVPGLVA